ncbi:GNAT family N-acetyltransferase [Streptomyces tauricus]|uniref:GNAT family N-acetyltransferase n=1 Tax=Streptomyces tauricus TaxID=68274 RepID=UPI002244ED6B|nr:GNAT family N-acetyltransferase [Streptomyces tauricus]MCW8102420.1 GNAT family N-acetyltransferase [Streptomyces tauricus]
MTHDAHVRLRPVEEADLEAFFAQEQDTEATRRSRFTARPRGRFMTHWATRILGDDTVLVRTVDVDGAPAGHIVAWWEEAEGGGGGDESAGTRRRFIGYWLGRPYWGRGIGTEALTLFLRVESVRPLHADPFPGNTASVRLLERHGFRRAGTVQHGADIHTLLVLDDAPVQE